MKSLEDWIKELIDRQKIWDCLLRYARGVDRLDRILMLSAFAVGRYIDRLVRQSDDWVIADRVCTTEGAADVEKNGLLATLKPMEGSIAIPTRDRADPSYRRPLAIPRIE